MAVGGPIQIERELVVDVEVVEAGAVRQMRHANVLGVLTPVAPFAHNSLGAAEAFARAVVTVARVLATRTLGACAIVSRLTEVAAGALATAEARCVVHAGFAGLRQRWVIAI